MLEAAAELTQWWSGPEAEISGPDEMYVPTTQLQIRPDGEWHRRSAIATETACGELYNACAVRDYQLTGDLCLHCFTPRERLLAANPHLIPPERI